MSTTSSFISWLPRIDSLTACKTKKLSKTGREQSVIDSYVYTTKEKEKSLESFPWGKKKHDCVYVCVCVCVCVCGAGNHQKMEVMC